MAKELRVIAPIVPAGDFEVANAKDIKAGDKRLDVALAEAAAEVEKKANKTDVNNELNKKASTEYVNAELSKKADQTDVAAELVTKANKIDTETALAGKASVEGLASANEAIADLSTEQAALSARMDTFTRLEEGSTTGDAELADGRVGADGKTYENIGGAIRGQVTDLKSDLSKTLTLTTEDLTPIPEGADLDTYLTVGNYKISSETTASTVLNIPQNTAGRLIVMATSMLGRYRQTYIANSTESREYTRFYNGERWCEWKEVAHVDSVEKVRNNSLTLNAASAVEIGTNDDFNNYITPGNFKVLTKTIASTIANIPTELSGRLTVISTSVSTYVIQKYETNSITPKTYVRTYTDGKWNAWYRLVLESDLGNVFDLRYDKNTIITDGTDLDTLKTVGNYKCNTISSVATLSNCPTSQPFKLLVIQTTGIERIIQLVLANTSDSAIYTRMYNGTSWSTWQKKANINETIRASDVMVTSNNYLDYFPNGSFNDVISNSIYGLSVDVPLTDGPEGDAWTGMGDRVSGYIRGTLLTFTQETNPSSVSSGIVQILIGYRNTSYKPTFSYRIATANNDEYSWSNWSKFEENGYLHASNKVIFGGSLEKTISDLNDAESNAIYQIDLNCDNSDEAHTLLNNPCPGISSVLMCYAFSYTTTHGRVQTLFNARNDMYYRYGYKQDTNDYRWTKWTKVQTSGDCVENKGRLDNGTDLNTILNTGIYLLGTNSGCINWAFDTYAGFLTTKTVNQVTMQTAEKLNGERKTRNSTDYGNSWTSWV